MDHLQSTRKTNLIRLKWSVGHIMVRAFYICLYSWLIYMPAIKHSNLKTKGSQCCDPGTWEMCSCCLVQRRAAVVIKDSLSDSFLKSLNSNIEHFHHVSSDNLYWNQCQGSPNECGQSLSWVGQSYTVTKSFASVYFVCVCKAFCKNLNMSGQLDKRVVWF